MGLEPTTAWTTTTQTGCRWGLRPCVRWVLVAEWLWFFLNLDHKLDPSFRKESIVDESDLVLWRGVVGVDLGRLGVGVAEELLDRADRCAGRREAGCEGVAQVVEADWPDTGVGARRLEALAELGPV